MDFANLVQIISARVLEELRKDGVILSGTINTAKAPTMTGPKVLVLANAEQINSPEWQIWQGKIRQAAGADAVLEYFQPGVAQSAQRYIVPSLCVQDMAALASGRATGPITRKILELLLLGKQVEVLEYGYLHYASTAPQALYELYSSYEHKLTSFGLKRISQSAFNTTASGSGYFKVGLVSEKDIKEAAAQGKKAIHVCAGTIITALAQDTAKELGIDILKDGGI